MISQPRRIAANSLMKRLRETLGNKVIIIYYSEEYGSKRFDNRWVCEWVLESRMKHTKPIFTSLPPDIWYYYRI